jgi:hypothetical protein
MKEVMKNKRIPRSTAIHEAAHGIASYRYSSGFQFITGLPDKETLGGCIHNETFGEALEMSPCPSPRQLALRYAVIYKAGMYAQARHSKKSIFEIAHFGGGGAADYEQAQFLTKYYGGRIGININKEMEMDFSYKTYKEVGKFIRDHWQPINALGGLIQARGLIQATDPDVKAITDTIERLPMELEIATEWVLKQPKRPKFVACEWD